MSFINCNFVPNSNIYHHHITFFERIAPYYDILLDLRSFGLYAKFLRKTVEFLALQKGEEILDLCSGTGRVASWIAQTVGEKGDVIGMDIAKSATRHHYKFILAVHVILTFFYIVLILRH